MKKILLNTVTVLASVVFAYLLVEGYARWKAYERYVKGKYPMSVMHEVDLKGDAGFWDKGLSWAHPYSDYYSWTIDENCNITFKTYFHANNLGLVSRRDQQMARQAGEYRIVVIGDSFTAAREMEIPWTDILQDDLNADPAFLRKTKGAKATVFNLGYPSGGFIEFERMSQIAKKLDPDLVIVNYIEADIHRCNDCFAPDDQADSQKPLELVSGKIDFPVAGEPETPKVSVTCESKPVSFDNPTCRHSFGLDAPPSIVENPEKLKALKQRILKAFVRGQLWTSTYPYAIRMALGNPVSLSELRDPGKYAQKPRKMRRFDADDQVLQAASVLSEIKSSFSRTLFVRDPDYEDLTGKGTDDLTKRIVKEHPGIGILDMRGILPKGLDKEEYHSWFCLPADGHMSQKGGYRYAKAMAAAIEQAMP